MKSGDFSFSISGESKKKIGKKIEVPVLNFPEQKDKKDKDHKDIARAYSVLTKLLNLCLGQNIQDVFGSIKFWWSSEGEEAIGYKYIGEKHRDYIEKAADYWGEVSLNSFEDEYTTYTYHRDGIIDMKMFFCGARNNITFEMEVNLYTRHMEIKGYEEERCGR